MQADFLRSLAEGEDSACPIFRKKKEKCCLEIIKQLSSVQLLWIYFLESGHYEYRELSLAWMLRREEECFFW